MNTQLARYLTKGNHVTTYNQFIGCNHTKAFNTEVSGIDILSQNNPIGFNHRAWHKIIKATTKEATAQTWNEEKYAPRHVEHQIVEGDYLYKMEEEYHYGSNRERQKLSKHEVYTNLIEDYEHVPNYELPLCIQWNRER